MTTQNYTTINEVAKSLNVSPQTIRRVAEAFDFTLYRVIGQNETSLTADDAAKIMMNPVIAKVRQS